MRLNTDGHGNVINHKNIVPELCRTRGFDFDQFEFHRSERIWGTDACRRAKMFPAMIEFAKECMKHRFDVTMTIVDLDSANEDRARQFVEREVGAKFRNRVFF